MSRVESKDREALPEWKFALPGERKYPIADKYPIEDKAHALNAKAREAQKDWRGNLSATGHRRVDARADAVLGKE